MSDPELPLCAFSEIYHSAREEFAGELEFWRQQIKPGFTCLEIGAGTGFVSQALLEMGPQRLILVEPERSASQTLRSRFGSEIESNRVELVEDRFDGRFAEQADAVLFPYDSLPMLSREDQAALFVAVRNTLVPGGRFSFHIFDEQWHSENFAQLSRGVEQEWCLKDGTIAVVSVTASPLTGKSYRERIEIRDRKGTWSGSFEFDYHPCSMEEIREMAAQAGLEFHSVRIGFRDSAQRPDGLVFQLFRP